MMLFLLHKPLTVCVTICSRILLKEFFGWNIRNIYEKSHRIHIIHLCRLQKKGGGGSKCCLILRTVVNDFWERSIFLNLWTFTRTENKSFFLLNVKVSFNLLKFSYGFFKLLHCFLETSLYLTYSFKTEERTAK